MLIFLTGGSRQGKSTIAAQSGYKVIHTDKLYHNKTRKMLVWDDIGKDLPIKKDFYNRGELIEGTALYCEKERALIEQIRGEKGILFLLDLEAGWERCWNRYQSLWKSQGKTEQDMKDHLEECKARYEGVRQEVAKGKATKWEDK